MLDVALAVLQSRAVVILLLIVILAAVIVIGFKALILLFNCLRSVIPGKIAEGDIEEGLLGLDPPRPVTWGSKISFWAGSPSAAEPSQGTVMVKSDYYFKRLPMRV